jgi:hypothetical protein
LAWRRDPPVSFAPNFFDRLSTALTIKGLLVVPRWRLRLIEVRRVEIILAGNPG